MEHIMINSIKEKSPFKDLFPIKPSTLDFIVKDIQQFGFDDTEGIVIWDDVCIDGHTRLKAARICDIETVPVVNKDFQSIDEAVDYVIHKQRNRRNLEDADILRYVMTMDKLRGKNKGRPKGKKIASSDAIKGKQNKSAEPLAKKLGTNASKIERARTVSDHADKASRDMILKGGATINKVYQEVQKKRQKPKPPQSKIKSLARTIMNAGTELHILIDGIQNGSIVPSHPDDREYFKVIRENAPYYIELFYRLGVNIPETYKFITGEDIKNDKQGTGGIPEKLENDTDNIIDIESHETAKTGRC